MKPTTDLDFLATYWKELQKIKRKLNNKIMPTPRPKHRTYCKTCQNFTIHNSDLICETCDTEFTSYFPSEVDSDLIQQQRKRYNEKKSQKIGGLYNAFMMGVGIETIMDTSWKSAEIVECDAGQEEIDRKRKEQREEAKRIGQEILDDYNTNYKHLNRNDKCTCGSNKKFKQCHLIHFRKHLNI